MKKARTTRSDSAPLRKRKVAGAADYALDEVSSEEGTSGSENGAESEEDEEEEETAEQKRRRLAKDYLQGMVAEQEEESEEESEGERHAEVSEKLRRNRLEASGKYFQDLAGSLSNILDAEGGVLPEESLSRLTLGAHKLPVTCVALSGDEACIISGSKDNSVIKWDTETGSKQVLKPRWRRSTHQNVQASSGETLAVSITSDGKYIVSGGRDKMLRIYDARQSQAEIKCFSGHRDAITSLAFRKDSKSLFSGSLDRCIKHWDLNEMGYLETLFGHQDGVNGVDCWTKEKPVSCSSDRTGRLWKVAEESHLVFRGDKGSLDAIQLLTEDSFVTGGQDGSLCLWKDTQKKPIRTISAAHGMTAGCSNWIGSIASVKMSNLLATGSNDGLVRLWSASAENRQVREVTSIKVDGFVNALAMSPRLLVVGAGREPKLGRWWCVKGNKNKVHVIRFPRDLSKTSDASESNPDDASGSGSGSGSGNSSGSESESGSDGRSGSE